MKNYLLLLIIQYCDHVLLLSDTKLSPFTDLDTEPSKLSAKLQSAKSAIVLMMRSWVGVVMISSDEMALPTLVQMLRDPKVCEVLYLHLMYTLANKYFRNAGSCPDARRHS